MTAFQTCAFVYKNHDDGNSSYLRSSPPVNMPVKAVFKCIWSDKTLSNPVWSLSLTDAVEWYPVHLKCGQHQILLVCSQLLVHWLTPRKGVHLFMYFLPTMRTPIELFSPHAYMHFCCFVVYALSALALNACTKVHLMYALTVMALNAYTTKQWKCIYAWGGNNWIGVCNVGRKYINRCAPFLGVSQWVV